MVQYDLPFDIYVMNIWSWDVFYIDLKNNKGVFTFIFTKEYHKLISREITQNRELCTYCFLLDMLNDFIEDYAHIKNPKLKEIYQW